MIRVKICGITNWNDASLAQDFGADALGFIFYKESKRYVDPHIAAHITGRLNPFVAKIGVFVNESIDNINEIVQHCRLTHVQLHGDESIDFAKSLNTSVIKAFNYTGEIHNQLKNWQNFDILIDSGDLQNRGGTGKTLPWDKLSVQIQRPFILAGGLNPGNVRDAIRVKNVVAVDVSSGVEKEYGKKDPEKLKNFILKAKSEFN